MNLAIPEFSLVLLIGPSGCGKSTFAARHFRDTEIVSSDRCRAMLTDDENDQSVNREAFGLLHRIVTERLSRGRLTVIDATNVRAESRASLISLARAHDAPLVAIVMSLPEALCRQRNQQRAARQVPADIIHEQCTDLQASLATLAKEGFQHVYFLAGVAEMDAAVIIRQPDEHAPCP
ncbi:MAG: AAA family ATPase [Blastocatellia bacterium]